MGVNADFAAHTLSGNGVDRAPAYNYSLRLEPGTRLGSGTAPG